MTARTTFPSKASSGIIDPSIALRPFNPLSEVAVADIVGAAHWPSFPLAGHSSAKDVVKDETKREETTTAARMGLRKKLWRTRGDTDRADGLGRDLMEAPKLGTKAVGIGIFTGRRTRPDAFVRHFAAITPYHN